MEAQPASGSAPDEKPSLWEAVLREVGSSRAAATRNVLVLGDTGSGKSSAVAQLLHASLRPQVGNGQDTAATAPSISAGIGSLNEPFGEIESTAALGRHDLALSYSYIDARDEDNEETLARLGIYQLASDRIADRELLKLVLDAQSFPGAAAVIVLDWSRPWRFVKSLLRWISVLSQAVEVVCSDNGGREAGSSKGANGWTLGRATVDECRERLERFLQEYSGAAETAPAAEEPAAAAASAVSGVSLVGRGSIGGANVGAKAADVLLPLGKGVLEANLGLPLIVVCTKADAMGVMERERGFKEEDFDYVQQVLRATCLRFGAALIYTSTHNPATFATLYHYLVHRLLTGPATLPAFGTDIELATKDAAQAPPEDGDDGETDTACDPVQQEGRHRSSSTARGGTGAVTAQSTLAYPFRVRANVVDRDLVFVPAGWDSAAKIGYLREPFEVHSVQHAWARDEKRYQAIVERAVRENAAATGAEQQAESGDAPPTTSTSLLLMFGEVVAAPRRRAGMDAEGGSAVAAAAAAAADMANQVAVEDDQIFFERLYEEQQEQMALEGEEAGDSGAHHGDAYGDGRVRMAGSSNRLVTSLLRNVHTAESSLSTASDVADAGSGNLSDDGGGDDLDRQDPGRAPSPLVRRTPTQTGGSVASHRRTDSGDAGANGSVGRASGSRLGWQTQSPPVLDAAAAAASMRRKLAAVASGGGSGGSGSATAATAAAVAGAPGDPGPAASNEELTSFFQNLLGRKGGVASSNASSSGKDSPQQPPRSLSNTLPRAAGAAKKDIQADLERWKAQLKRQKE